jgi:hypothetical protein
MKNLTEPEFLSFLYAEKERLHTNFSKPGWSNWAIGGAFIALLGFGFKILKTSLTENIRIQWEAVLMLSICLLSITIILKMLYSLLFSKKEIYYPNRINTRWDETPIFDFIVPGVLYLTITILLIIIGNYSWILYVFGYLSFFQIKEFCKAFYKRNELVPSGSKHDIPKLLLSGTKYNSIPTNWIKPTSIYIAIILFTLIAVCSLWNYIIEFSLYLHEVQIAAFFIGFWILTYIFFKTNSTSNKMLNSIDNIIDKYAYSEFSKQDAMKELMCLRYGSSMNQIIKNDKTFFFNALTKLEPINTQLDIIKKIVDESKLTTQIYFEWLIYRKNERPKIIDTISKGKKLIDYLDNINKAQNNVRHSDDFKSLITLTKSGLDKIGATQNKFKVIDERFMTFRETYYCRKSGSVCTKLECKKRNDKMSIKYALKKLPLKYALYLILFRKR